MTSLPAYASVPTLGHTDAYLDAIEGYAAQGFTAIKVHAWGVPSRDAELLRAVRARFGSLILMHDAEGRYDAEGAALVARACAEVGARWFEAPLPDFDLDGYRHLRATVPGVSILAAGDVIWDPRLLADALRDPPWDAVRFDVSFVGGFTPTRELMSVAERAGMDVELISYGHTVIQAANLHAALAFGRTSFFEQAAARAVRARASNRSAQDLTGSRARPRDRARHRRGPGRSRIHARRRRAGEGGSR